MAIKKTEKRISNKGGKGGYAYSVSLKSPSKIPADQMAQKQMSAIQAEEPINILMEANKIIYGDREKAYGSPRFNLDTIAKFWSVYLQRKFPGLADRADFTAEDVAQMMILLKSARLIHNPTHVDSLTDQAGYAALQHRIQGM